MKCWEIILENLRNAGWNWVVAAERSDAGRFIVHADQELPAFLELESAIRDKAVSVARTLLIVPTAAVS